MILSVKAIVGWCLQQEEYCENYREISITPLEMANCSLNISDLRTRKAKVPCNQEPRSNYDLLRGVNDK